jgi:hypothetical protein
MQKTLDTRMSISSQICLEFRSEPDGFDQAPGKILYPWREQSQLRCTKNDIEDEKVALYRGGGRGLGWCHGRVDHENW